MFTGPSSQEFGQHIVVPHRLSWLRCDRPAPMRAAGPACRTKSLPYAFERSTHCEAPPFASHCRWPEHEPTHKAMAEHWIANRISPRPGPEPTDNASVWATRPNRTCDARSNAGHLRGRDARAARELRCVRDREMRFADTRLKVSTLSAGASQCAGIGRWMLKTPRRYSRAD